MSDAVTYLPLELPLAFTVLRLSGLDKIVITRADWQSTACSDELFAPEPKPERAFVATAYSNGHEWLAADGNSEAQALRFLNRDVGEHYL